MNRKYIVLAALLALSGATYAQTRVEVSEKRVEYHPTTERAPTPEEQLSLAALEGLMAQPPDRALPILKRVLAGSQTPLVKQRALFVLCQIDSPEAHDILTQMAKSPDAAMRGEAIRNIGIGGDKKSLGSLLAIYNTGSADVKDEVLQAWLIADDKESVYQAALNAKTEEESNNAIHILGAMNATEELRKLGDRPNAPSGLVDAFAISGDLASLRKIAESNTNHAARVDAVQKIGIVDSDAARAALREIYTRSTDDIKEAALQGMLISQDEEGVLALYRASKSSDEKRALLRTLSLIDGDAALKAIDAALENK